MRLTRAAELKRRTGHSSKFRFLSLVLIFTLILTAGERSRAAVALGEPLQSRDAQIQSIIDDIPAAPPELGADILLKLVESGDIRDPKQRQSALDEAWELAPKARFAAEISSANSVIVESETGSMVSALPGLTTESIQLRVIRQRAAIDASAARELFSRMKAPEADSPPCTDSQFKNNKAYFDALTSALGTFSAEEIQRGDAARFLKAGIASLTSPEDFRVSLDLIQNGKFPEQDFSQLMDQWTESLQTVRIPDRKFSILGSLFKQALQAAARERDNVRSPDKILQALRTYFVRHTSAVRCEDGTWRPMSTGPGVPPANNEEVARELFNKELASLGSGVSPISPEEILPSRLNGRARVRNYLTNDRTSKVWEIESALKGLQFGPELKEPPLTAEERNTPEWNVRALQYLTLLENWTKELGQEDREVFVLKSEFYGALLRLAPEGKLRDTVMKSFVGFLVQSPMKRESPPEWQWWGIRNLVTAKEIQDKKVWLDEIEAAGDKTISLYTRVARLELK